MVILHGRPTIEATRARQGRLGRNVIWVLIFGVLLTVLAFAAIWAWEAGDLASTEPKNATQRADVAGFNAPPPSQAIRQNQQTSRPLAPKSAKPTS